MEQFDGNELITINLRKYEYLLECRKKVVAKKISEFDVTEHRANVLKDSGIVTVRDLKHFIINNYPTDVDISSVTFRGFGSTGSQKLLYSVLK